MSGDGAMQGQQQAEAPAQFQANMPGQMDAIVEQLMAGYGSGSGDVQSYLQQLYGTGGGGGGGMPGGGWTPPAQAGQEGQQQAPASDQWFYDLLNRMAPGATVTDANGLKQPNLDMFKGLASNAMSKIPGDWTGNWQGS